MAAHIETLESRLRPEADHDGVLIVDGLWWSTLLDGQARGVPPEPLEKMVEIERHYWQRCQPSAVVLLRDFPPEDATLADQRKGRALAYEDLAARADPLLCPVHEVAVRASVEETLAAILATVPGLGVYELPAPMPPKADLQSAVQLDLALAAPLERKHTHWVFTRHSAVRASKVFTTYWRFAAERQEIFFKRLTGAPPPWTDDPILGRFKFTNAYRAADRVSQFLIRSVIYEGSQSLEEVFFRTLLFKLFNKIDTWKLLERELGVITYAEYDFTRYERVLTQALARGERIYSAAYVMPAASRFEHQRKHGTHLHLLDHLIKEQVPQKIAQARGMREAFHILRSFPMMGDFLAYQYLTDLNYSEPFDFKEDFIVPGPGARDGIRKCFEDLGGLTESQIIELVTDMQDQAFEELGIRFRRLWGRRLQLIDCQNLFCEVDKYARLAHPDVQGISGRTRIKQHYRYDAEPINYWFPRKWGLNEEVSSYIDALRRGDSLRDAQLLVTGRG
ncbi:nucleotide kinase domain-containing protein [Stigmatella aurantiaca]|nr:nucleotide kinase domain-containing protein [Stigmatella aurantiaca]